MFKMIKAIILANENPHDHLLWVKACDKHKARIDYRVVNLTESDWFERIHEHPFDIFFAKPGALTIQFKQLYDERIYVLNKVLGYPVFPSAEEIFIHENKRFLSYWLKANHIPHPETTVFYYKNEAEKFVNKQVFPIVGKVNIGASGSGVKILKTREDALEYIREAFAGKGAPRRSGPDIKKGGLFRRGVHYIFHPSDIPKKLKTYRMIRSNPQIGFVIFQEYIPHLFEWRCVRIGDSFFAHKKIVKGEKASGSLIKGYENPPLPLLDFVKQVTDIRKFVSQAVDIFEAPEGGYLVNEMHCIFGQSDLYQMLVDGIPGRYVLDNGQWRFEAGDFCSNECYDLRVDYVLKLIKN